MLLMLKEIGKKLFFFEIKYCDKWFKFYFGFSWKIEFFVLYQDLNQRSNDILFYCLGE